MLFRIIQTLFPSASAQLRRIIRKEIQKDVQQNLVTHSAARQSLDLYEMRLETLDTRLAKRFMAMEDRITELEARVTPIRARQKAG
ncbi:MAG: hypothetical protein AAGH83_08000 [Pseudomonadota bacterium]